WTRGTRGERRILQISKGPGVTCQCYNLPLSHPSPARPISPQTAASRANDRTAAHPLPPLRNHARALPPPPRRRHSRRLAVPSREVCSFVNYTPGSPPIHLVKDVQILQ
uniref:Uncharacterized protein n=1 Tax=Leersia perrieri TaxID=77586 RepID=A0A0D9VR18_9ORYZ